MLLKGKTAIVTGGGSGIGRATALRFAQEGASVIVGDINQKEGEETASLIMEAKGEGFFHKTDVTVGNQVKSLIATALHRYGKLDILFNNAGMEVFTTIADTTEEEWERTINVNLKGVFLGMKYALPIMKDQGSGSIINMASVAGLAAWPGLGVYSAAKGGVVLLTKAGAAEYGKYGIRVNSICPGSILTPLLQKQFFGAMADPSAAEEQLLKHYPLNRLGNANEVADAVVFLASGNSTFITGHSLTIDGGLSSFVGDLI